MATKNGNRIRAIKKSVVDALKEIQSSAGMRQLGREATTIVRRRTLLGFGVPSNGAPREKLKSLSTSYKQQRRGEIGFFTKNNKVIPFVPKTKPTLSSKTTPSKSNLTFSGELLDSLKEFVTGLGKVEVRPTGTRRDGLTNEQVAEFVSKERPFLNLSNNEIKQLTILANDQFEKIVNKKLTKL